MTETEKTEIVASCNSGFKFGISDGNLKGYYKTWYDILKFLKSSQQMLGLVDRIKYHTIFDQILQSQYCQNIVLMTVIQNINTINKNT